MELRTLGAAALCAAIAATAHGGDARRITFTTESDEARRQALEAVRRIETFQQGPQIQEAAKKAIAADPDFAWGHYLLAAATFPPPQAKPEHDKALELVAKASPGEQKYLAAIKLNREQKGKEALAAFQALREEYPDERMVHMMIGQLSLNQGQFAEARQAFERAIALDDTTPRAHALIGNVLMLQGRYAEARAQYDAALGKRAPGTAPGGVFYPRSLSYLYEGKVDDALSGLEGFLSEYKQNKLDAAFPEVFIWNSIARINLENGRLEEAMKA
jgi:tetratricopeptide (TPR) repeat protein